MTKMFSCSILNLKLQIQELYLILSMYRTRLEKRRILFLPSYPRPQSIQSFSRIARIPGRNMMLRRIQMVQTQSKADPNKQPCVKGLKQDNDLFYFFHFCLPSLVLVCRTETNFFIHYFFNHLVCILLSHEYLTGEKHQNLLSKLF